MAKFQIHTVYTLKFILQRGIVDYKFIRHFGCVKVGKTNNKQQKKNTI